MEWSTADFRRESGHSAPQNFSAKKVDFPRARAYPIAIAIAEGVVAGCVRAQDLEPPGDSYADCLHSIRYWNGEFPFEEGIRRRRPSSRRALMPMSAGDAPALAAGRPFSARIAPIYEGELRPSEEAALSGYIAVSGLYRAYISMETEGGEADITALLAGATLRLPAEADIPEEELAKYGALFAPNEGAAALLAAAYGEGPSADGVARQYWTSALSGRGLYALVAAG